MFDEYAGLLYDRTAKNKRLVQFLLIFLIAISLAFLFSVQYESSMEDMLPEDETIIRDMEFFRNSNIAGKVIVSLGLTSPEYDSNDLIREIDVLAASLDKDIFSEITVGMSNTEFSGDLDAMFSNLPAIISESDLSRIDGWINQEYVSGKLRESYLQILKPQGIFMNSMVRSDPLGIRLLVLGKLKFLLSSTGYNMEIKDGHFISRDGRHAMLIANSSVPVTDSEGGKRLLASLKKSLARLPQYISADIISGHAHTVSNEKLIKADITFISIFASVLFLSFFVLVIRDFSAVLIFMVPVIAILFAVDLSYLFLGKLSYWVIGLGCTVAGITIDYGTHVYFAARGKTDPSPFVKHVIKPVAFGALTTVAIFTAFFFSNIEGYRQLAVFSILSVVLSTAISIFVLPHIIVKTKSRGLFADRLAERLEDRRISSGLMVLLWVFFTFVFVYFSIYVEVERDIKKIDGTEQDIVQAEKRFQEIWGGGNTPAVLVINATDYETALETNERIYMEAVQTLGAENISSLSAILPSEKMRKENTERWESFWSDGREQKIRGLLHEEGRAYNFSEDAFLPFFEGLKINAGNDMPDLNLARRFTQTTDHGYRLMSFFPDSKEYVDEMNNIIRRYPGTYLVSAGVLSETLSHLVSEDLRRMTWIAGISVIVFTFICFLNIRETLIALVPPLTSIIWLLGLMSLLGLTINGANMVAGVLAIGITSDYGIFITYKSRQRVETGTVLAITLCTVTTIIGAGVLIFAKHPALSSVGITMLIGVGSGFLASITVVPKLYELFARKR